MSSGCKDCKQKFKDNNKCENNVKLQCRDYVVGDNCRL